MSLIPIQPRKNVTFIFVRKDVHLTETEKTHFNLPELSCEEIITFPIDAIPGFVKAKVLDAVGLKIGYAEHRNTLVLSKDGEDRIWIQKNKIFVGDEINIRPPNVLLITTSVYNNYKEIQIDVIEEPENGITNQSLVYSL